MTSSTPEPATAKSDQATTAMRLVALILALAFFVSPYLFTFDGTTLPGKDSVVGSELAGDGLKLVLGHETLVGIQNGTSGLGETLTAPWWGQMHTEQKLWRPVPLFLLGVAGGLAGEPYDPDDPGDSPFPYHALVLAFHLLATLLLFELALELTGSNKVALVTAALFATLPVHTEAIFDVAGLAELCAASFGLGSWLLWLRAGEQPLKQPALLAGSLACLALAALSKESAFALPLVFFLVDAGRGGGRLDFGRALGKLPALGAMVVVLALLLGLRASVLGSLLPEYGVATALDNPLLSVGAFERGANGLRLMACALLVMVGINPLRGQEGFHLDQLFGFSADYSASQVDALGLLSPWNLLGILAVLGSVVVALLAARRCSMRAGLWLALLASLLVTSNVLFPIGTAFAERLLYFPSALLVLFLALFLVRLGKAGVAVGVLLAVGGGLWTSARAEAWESPRELIKVTERVDAPLSAKAKFLVALDLRAGDLLQLAVDKFEEAIEIYPDYAVAEGLLATTLEANLQHAEALPHYLRNLEIRLEDSGYTYGPEPYGVELGMTDLLTRVTQLRVYTLDDAQGHLDWLDELVQRGYDSPHAHYNRGRTLLKLGRVSEGEAAYLRSLEVEPTILGVAYLGELLRKLGRHDEALAHYDRYADEALWLPGERAELLLRQADAELGFDVNKALATTELLKPLVPQMQPEQLFRLKWTWAQAKLDSLPADPSGREQALRQIENELKSAFAIFNVANETTHAARYALVEIFGLTGNYEELVLTAEEMLSYRSMPLLRTRLAAGYGALGEDDKALENWRTAAEELVNEDGSPVDAESLMTARRGLLQALPTEEAAATLADWSAAGGGDGLALGLEADWYAGQGRLEEAIAAAERLAASAAPGLADTAGLLAQLRAWAAQDDFAAGMGLTQHMIAWANFEVALPQAERTLGLATEDMGRAQALGLVANCLLRLDRKQEAIERLDQALALELPQAFKDQIQATREQVVGG